MAANWDAMMGGNFTFDGLCSLSRGGFLKTVSLLSNKSKVGPTPLDPTFVGPNCVVVVFVVEQSMKQNEIVKPEIEVLGDV